MILLTSYNPTEDEKGVLELIQILQDYECLLNPELAKPTEEYCAKYLNLMIEECTLNEGIIIVAKEEHNNTPIGFIAAWKESDDSLYPSDYFWYSIQALSVHPSFRKRGIGSLLLKKVEEFALNKKITKLTVNALAANQLALSLYQTNGFSALEIVLKKDLK